MGHFTRRRRKPRIELTGGKRIRDTVYGGDFGSRVERGPHVLMETGPGKREWMPIEPSKGKAEIPKGALVKFGELVDGRVVRTSDNASHIAGHDMKWTHEKRVRKLKDGKAKETAKRVENVAGPLFRAFLERSLGVKLADLRKVRGGKKAVARLYKGWAPGRLHSIEGLEPGREKDALQEVRLAFHKLGVSGELTPLRGLDAKGVAKAINADLITFGVAVGERRLKEYVSAVPTKTFSIATGVSREMVNEGNLARWFTPKQLKQVSKMPSYKQENLFRAAFISRSSYDALLSILKAGKMDAFLKVFAATNQFKAFRIANERWRAPKIRVKEDYRHGNAYKAIA